MLFVSYLSLKVSPPTIKVYLTAVCNLHLEARLPEVFDNLTLLPRPVQGIKRVFTRDRRPRLPITPHILVQFNQHLNLHWRDHSVLWSAMIIAFFAFLRSSELLALRRSDVTILDDRSDPPMFGLRIRSLTHSVVLSQSVSHPAVTLPCVRQKPLLALLIYLTSHILTRLSFSGQMAR